MERHRLSRTLVLEYWLPLLSWQALTYWFSTDRFSSGQTSLFILPVLKFFYPGLTPEQFEILHHIIRKLCHITEYFILAILASRAVHQNESERTRAQVLSFAFVVLAAMTDEYHQSFTLSRGASVVDVGYDSFGGLLAIWGLAHFGGR